MLWLIAILIFAIGVAIAWAIVSINSQEED